MPTHIVNSFSVNMIRPGIGPFSVRFTPWEPPHNIDEISEDVDFAEGKYSREEVEKVMLVSAVGHADTAALFSSTLGFHIPVNRVNVTLDRGDRVLLGQYRGPRLPEGSQTLPEGATIEWFWVEVE